MINDSFYYSLQGGIPFSVTFNPSLDAHITSVYAVFVKSDIVLGNVEMVILPDCLLGRKIPGLLTFNQISHNVSNNSQYLWQPKLLELTYFLVVHSFSYYRLH